MDELMTGLDLNDGYTQVRCYDKERSWTIPTVICCRKGEETWLSGEDAYVVTLLGEGVIVDKFLKLAAKDGTPTIGSICYNGSTLLKLFVRKMLEYPEKEFSKDKVAQPIITLQNVGTRFLGTLMHYAGLLGIPRERVHVISYTKNFIHYILSQKKELWTNQVGLLELSSRRLYYYEMKITRGMGRNMVQAEAQNREKAFNLGILDPPSGNELADRILCSCGEKLLNRKLLSTVLLTGRGFEHQG